LAVFLLLSSGIGLATAPPVRAEVDHGRYAELLRLYVNQGVVDYSGLKQAEDRLDGYLEELEAVDPDHLGPKEQFAFFVNAYNAWTIKLILSGYPEIDSIKDLGSLLKSPWKKKWARINGQVLTLDHIEHDILRPRFKDPRVHFAVNCASKGCPPLVSEPFIGAKLDGQLDTATRAFINDPQYNYLNGDTLYVSSIFKWFKKDFNKDIPGFFIRYAEPNLAAELKSKGKRLKVKYLDYDWSLNGN
jgi:hypothetical protein